MEDYRDQLLEEMRRKRDWFRAGHRWWSLAYNVPLYATPLAGLLTTVSAATKFPSVVTLWAGAVTTALAAMSSIGRFGAKWRANRESRSALDQLLVSALKSNANLDAIADKFIEVIKKEDTVILGT